MIDGLALAALLPAALFAAGCATGTVPAESIGGVTGAGGGDATTATSTGAGAGGGGGGGGDWNGHPWESTACSEPTQFVYVVTTGAQLYRFWPPTLSFELVGHLDCPTNWTPMSMAIDRHATAWVLYMDQIVYRLDLATGNCFESGYNAEHVIGIPFGYFGMAFTADPSSPDAETLFVREAAFYDLGADPGVRPLGRFDTASTKIATLGVGLGANADLAGTGDGRLFGFEKLVDPDGVDALGTLAEYDTATGARIAVTELPGVTIGNAWAVAAWGGDVYLFSNAYGGTTRVIRYDPETEGVDVVVDDVGFEVIGAGVSACAPVEPPG
jgi:hypothetical protein